MPFTVAGRRLGRPVRVRWDDGVLEGDEGVELAVDELIERGDDVGLVPVGPWYSPGLEEPWRALLTIRAVLDGRPPPTVLADDAEELEAPDLEELGDEVPA